MLVSTAKLVALALVLVPSLASAAIFPKDTHVKLLDPKGFRQAMKSNQTSMIAFVAPWCGHCQRLAPEYSKLAKSLHPLVPVYAVDCDAEHNKRLCADEGVKGFPTVKLFPRGKQLGSMTYESGERTATALFNWASRRVPNTITKLSNLEDIQPWAQKTKEKHVALLLTKDKKVPLLWKVLGNQYKGQFELAVHRDEAGQTSVALGLERGGEKQAKVLIYPEGSSKFVRYEGSNKLEPISKLFDSILDGTANLALPVEEEPVVEESVSEPETVLVVEKEEPETAAAPKQDTQEPKVEETVVAEEKEAESTEPESEPETTAPPEEDTQEPKVEEPVVADEKEAESTEPEPAEPEVSPVLVQHEEQVVIEQPKEEKEKPAVKVAQCAPAEDGPGAEAPYECDPPVEAAHIPERPTDEL
ncbi:hypothetical protein H0H93_004807 [Arthromyces matolae]|nr:hypothetical protein H0H93_004807 [Arthromyces matolae]